MKKLTDDNILLLKTYCAMKGIKGEIDDFGNVLEVTKVEGPKSKKTILGIEISTKGPDIEVKTIKTSLQELMGQCVGVEYDPNAIVIELVRVGLLSGQR